MESPYPECKDCGGEGVDADPYGLFDYPCIKACPKCKENEEKDEREYEASIK